MPFAIRKKYPVLPRGASLLSITSDTKADNLNLATDVKESLYCAYLCYGLPLALS